MSHRSFVRASVRRQARATVVAPLPVAAPDYFTFPEHGITCFHCGETFHSVKSAREHFGATPDEDPGCVLKLSQGDKGMLGLVRQQFAELDMYRREDQPIMREIYALGAKHSRELIAAEQLGYDRGLADGRAEATEHQAKAGDETQGGQASEPCAEPVSRAAAGRSAAATSEPMDVTAGETAPMLSQLLDDIAMDARLASYRQEEAPAPVAKATKPVALARPIAERIDLSTVPSGMERQAVATAFAPAIAASQDKREIDGQVPCRCGAKGIHGYGMVPRWFGRDCIEAACPLKAAAA